MEDTRVIRKSLQHSTGKLRASVTAQLHTRALQAQVAPCGVTLPCLHTLLLAEPWLRASARQRATLALPLPAARDKQLCVALIFLGQNHVTPWQLLCCAAAQRVPGPGTDCLSFWMT